MKRTASAVWTGGLKDGKGSLTTSSKVLSDTAYSFTSRFGDAPNTNPEELIAAAHAGCFAMATSAMLGEKGFTPDRLEATATLTLEQKDGGWAITASHLVLKGKVPGITPEVFREIVQNAKTNCPVSKVLNAQISLDATLES